MRHKVNQHHINTTGDVVAGHKITLNQQLNAFDKLVANLRKEIQEGEITKDDHSILNHYDENIDSEIIGLEKKLEKAEINKNTIKKAMKLKEVFSKILARRRFYKSGQDIYSE